MTLEGSPSLLPPSFPPFLPSTHNRRPVWGLGPVQALPHWRSALSACSAEPAYLGESRWPQGQRVQPPPPPRRLVLLSAAELVLEPWERSRPRRQAQKVPLFLLREVSPEAELGLQHSRLRVQASVHCQVGHRPKGEHGTAGEVKGELLSEPHTRRAGFEVQVLWVSPGDAHLGSPSWQAAGSMALGQHLPPVPPCPRPSDHSQQALGPLARDPPGNQDFGLSCSCHLPSPGSDPPLGGRDRRKEDISPEIQPATNSSTGIVQPGAGGSRRADVVKV